MYGTAAAEARSCAKLRNLRIVYLLVHATACSRTVAVQLFFAFMFAFQFGCALISNLNQALVNAILRNISGIQVKVKLNVFPLKLEAND